MTIYGVFIIIGIMTVLTAVMLMTSFEEKTYNEKEEVKQN